MRSLKIALVLAGVVALLSVGFAQGKGDTDMGAAKKPAMAKSSGHHARRARHHRHHRHHMMRKGHMMMKKGEKMEAKGEKMEMKGHKMAKHHMMKKKA